MAPDMFLSILEQLGVNSSFFIMMAIFFSVFLVNYFLSVGNLSETLIERDKRMSGREKEIKSIQAELLEISSELSAQMKKAQAEAGKRFTDLKTGAIERQRNLLQEARAQSAQRMATLRDDLNVSAQRESQKLDKEVDGFVTLILERFSQTTSLGVSSKPSPRSEA